MEPKGSLPCIEQPAICTYPEPDQSPCAVALLFIPFQLPNHSVYRDLCGGNFASNKHSGLVGICKRRLEENTSRQQQGSLQQCY